jgi:cytochrome c oxidase subunit 1
MVLAALSGALLLIAFVAFLYNIIMTVGVNGLLGIFKAPKLRTTDLLPKA